MIGIIDSWHDIIKMQDIQTEKKLYFSLQYIDEFIYIILQHVFTRHTDPVKILISHSNASDSYQPT